MSLPTLQTERKIKYENTTTALSNWGLSAKPKNINFNPVTDGYTSPFAVSLPKSESDNQMTKL